MRASRTRCLATCLGMLTVSAAAADPAWTQSGEATWYGPRHAGHRTTSGEIFNPRAMTAAHPSLPLGSYVRVTASGSGRSVVVKINDREPPHGVRVIDLSHEAAARLGFVRSGVTDVTLEPVPADQAVEVADAPQPTASRATAPHGRRHRRHVHRSA